MKYDIIQFHVDAAVVYDVETKRGIAKFYGEKSKDHAELFISLVSLNWSAPSKSESPDVHLPKYINGVTPEAAKILDARERIAPTQLDESEQPERGNELSGEPEFYRTGIKVRGGKEFYKCHYKCPNCATTGKHYIPINIKTVSCHNCSFDMTVRPATPEGFPNRDEFGNFFTAYTLG